jgi:hypothetical protein
MMPTFITIIEGDVMVWYEIINAKSDSYSPSSPKRFSNKVLCINTLEERFGLLLVATFW